MELRIFIEQKHFAVEIKNKDKRQIRYSNIPSTYKGGEIKVLEQSDDVLVYQISPLYEKLNTENGYMINYNIKLTNWLNLFVYRSIQGVLHNSDLKIKKDLSEFSRELKEFTKVKLND